MIDLEIGILIIAAVFFAFGWAAGSWFNGPKSSTARIYPLPRRVAISGHARVDKNGVIENVDLDSVFLTDSTAYPGAITHCRQDKPAPPKGRTIKEHHNPRKRT